MIRIHDVHISQETNEMSGSRGEANFVWKCKNCKACTAQDNLLRIRCKQF
jgi:hypothetical protein